MANSGRPHLSPSPEDQATGFWRAIGEEGYKLVKEDPRRVAHAVKVGLAIAALSLLHYYSQTSGVDGLLTITTLLVVFEYTVGATLGEGLNRLFATLLGVVLGFGVHHLVTLLPEKYEGMIGLSVTFIVATQNINARMQVLEKAMKDQINHIEAIETKLSELTVIQKSRFRMFLQQNDALCSLLGHK
ncbi:hypothetical protein SASPL_142976 [Salvia splendens]|uniref:Aluminum-activated malate transporter n=1 Tax=Salvia splendens TaxID=180675 RepID=A0A8X8WMR0_SALSN|nr:hypothetical protein SASPL_142976 [Salvia splendens]